MTQNMQQLETFADQVVADVAATPSGVMTNIGHILVPPMTVHCCHCRWCQRGTATGCAYFHRFEIALA